MNDRRVACRLISLAAVVCCSPAWGDVPSPAAILQEMRKFAQTGRVLMVAAHPDDENTQLITYLARGRNYSMAYLSVTRGDGGQNVLGPEFGDELGWIRTQELLAARRLDGGEQFFTRARDFGFSKTPVETLKIWDKPAVLGDVVRVIRTFRPDVIVTRFSPTQGNTHGHHTASAILAVEAFKLAGDPKAYPEQLKTLSVWQTKRIVQNTGGPARGGGGGGAIGMEVGGDDPVLNLSYGQIAARSRAMHKSQGFANFGLNGGAGGRRTETFNLLDGEPATTDIMDGVDTTWGRFPGGESVAAKIDDAIAKFDPNNPTASVPALVAIKEAVVSLPRSAATEEKTSRLDRLICDCVGLSVETTLPMAELTPGESFVLEHRITIGTSVRVRLTKITAGTGSTVAVDPAAEGLTPGQALSRRMQFKLAEDQPLTQPYWLSSPARTGIYMADDPNLIGRPENRAVVPVVFEFDVGGQFVEIHTEPRGGVDGRHIEVIAPVSLGFPFGVRLFKPGTPREVTVEATAHGLLLSSTVRLSSPPGWKVEPAERPFNSTGPNQKQTFSFLVTPPVNATTADLVASIDIGRKTYDTGREEIRYPHIPPLLLQPKAQLRAVCVDIATAGHEIGYLPGAGDNVADCLREMGYAVTILTGDDLDAEKLKKFDAVVIGVRAFSVRPDLGEKSKAIFDYAAAGGTVVEQYNRPDGLKGAITPYPLRLTNSRITDESAAMTFLAPDHPVLNTPNKITAADFDGWVQERGIYFPTQWDDHWTAVLGGNDPGEGRLDGGLLVARHGKGYFVYTGLVFFRELPAGVPGAYRLFANLVSLRP